MVTKLGPLCKVKLLENNGDKAVVRSPEKAGVDAETRATRLDCERDLRRGVRSTSFRADLQRMQGRSSQLHHDVETCARRPSIQVVDLIPRAV